MRVRSAGCGVIALVLGLAVGCSSGNPGGDADGGPGARDGGSEDGGVQACVGPDSCDAWNVRSFCDGAERKTETCAGGCFQGACSTTACADECALGDTRGGQLCQLWDMASQSFVATDPASSLHDRAREHLRVLRAGYLTPGGGLSSVVHYVDPERTTLDFWSDLGDSALFTGSLLAAEAWRLDATGSADAAAQIRRHTDTLHRWFAISGEPGNVARFAAPRADTSHLPEIADCDADSVHCVDWEGEPYAWKGHISRDQYTGVMLGYYLAYHASADPEVRAMIRNDVVVLARELMKQRTDVPTRLMVDNVPFDTTLDVDNAVLIQSEMEGGKLLLAVDTGNVGDSEIQGVREFLPDLGPVLRQLPLLGWVPTLPRPGSAMMIGAFFSMALSMTEDVPGMAQIHDELRAYYESRIDRWLDIAATWSFQTDCGAGYFGNHIAYIMVYVHALAETDPNLRHRVSDTIFDGRMWQALRGHKNPYFAMLWAGTRTDPEAGDVAAAIDQLRQYGPPPRFKQARDNEADYPHDATCTRDGHPLCSLDSAVDVGDRVADGFLWERPPWQLFDPGDERLGYSGLDYLAAYWAGRRHGWIADDRAGTCARFD